MVQHLNTLKSISLPHFCSLFHSLLCLYADEELDREKLFPCSFSLFLLSGRSFSHHGLKFRSLIEVTVCLVVCISIRLTSAFFFFFLFPAPFSFSFLSLSVSRCGDQRLISEGYICHIRFPSLPRHEIMRQLVEAFYPESHSSTMLIWAEP